MADANHRPGPRPTTQLLQTSRKNTFCIEGVRNFIRAVDHGFCIDQIVYSEKLLTNPVARKLVRQCRRSGVATQKVSPEAFREVSQAKRASGIAALARQRWHQLDQTDPNQGLCWILIDRVNSPGNLGTLIRSANAVGAAGFIFVNPNVSPYSADVVRAAMGAVFCQTYIRTSWPALSNWVAAHRCEVIGASPHAKSDLHRLSPPKHTPLLVLGEERRGLTDQQTDLCQRLVRIPMQPGTDSLNLGVAGSLIMYELLRSSPSP